MRLHSLSSFLRRHWFLVCLVLVIAVARWDPSVGCRGGPLHPEVSRGWHGCNPSPLHKGASIKYVKHGCRDLRPPPSQPCIYTTFAFEPTAPFLPLVMYILNGSLLTWNFKSYSAFDIYNQFPGPSTKRLRGNGEKLTYSPAVGCKLALPGWCLFPLFFREVVSLKDPV